MTLNLVICLLALQVIGQATCCSNALGLNWIPIERYGWGVNVGAARTAQSWTIPSSVPSNASEILVYVTITMGNCNPNTANSAQIYTEIDNMKCSHYIRFQCYPGQNAVNTNSDNIWLPMGPDRKLYLYMPVGLYSNVGMGVYVTGYKKTRILSLGLQHSLRKLESQRLNWFPIELGSGWRVNVGAGQTTQSWTIPSSVPTNASEILVYVTITMGNCNPNTANSAQVYTEIDSMKYSHYIQFQCYPQNAINSNSDNIWLPIGRCRKLYVYMPIGFYNNVGMRVHVTGYKLTRTSLGSKPSLLPNPNWFPIELGPGWRVNVGAGQIDQSWTIPSTVPTNASEILVYATIRMGNCNPNTAKSAQVYTEIDSMKYSHFIQFQCYPGQNAFNTNSENIWLPIGPCRRLYVYMPVGFYSNVAMRVHVTGYK